MHNPTPVGENAQPHPVLVLDGGKGQYRAKFQQGVPLAGRPRAVPKRGGQIHSQHDLKFAFLDEGLHEGGIQARSNVPINGSKIVLRGVFPNLVEFQPPSPESALVGPLQKGFHGSARDNLQPADFF
jgi:hypothetical protein